MRDDAGDTTSHQPESPGPLENLGVKCRKEHLQGCPNVEERIRLKNCVHVDRQEVNLNDGQSAESRERWDCKRHKPQVA